MRADGAAEADDPGSALLGRWARGYCVARGYRPPVPALNGRSLWFDVEKPGQLGWYVLTGQGVEVLAAIVLPDVFVEIAAPRATLLPTVPAGWQVRTPAFLMTVKGRWWSGETAPPQGSEVQHLSFQGAVQLTVHDEGGQLAARGAVGRASRTVVFDQVVTEPAFRRLGLGSFVVRELARRAFIEGATEHLLIATEEGRALYERLGWTVLSDVVSLVSPSAAMESAGELEGIAGARCAT